MRSNPQHSERVNELETVPVLLRSVKMHNANTIAYREKDYVERNIIIEKNARHTVRKKEVVLEVLGIHSGTSNL